MMSILDYRPEIVKHRLGSKSPLCLIGSRPIMQALLDENVMIMACNIRIKHAVPGILRAAEELDAVVAFEIAKSEGNLQGGYTGFTPQLFWDTIVAYANRVNFTKPFFIHGDHVTVKNLSDQEFASSAALIEAELQAGFSSIAIDASFNELEDNIRITTQLAQSVSDPHIGLEVEIGEIKLAGQEGRITTMAEAVTFLRTLKENGIRPDLLAINNGSKHGNYLPGEEIHIDLQRTGEIFRAIRPFNVAIAQHGITGTPLHLMWQFTEYGIRKGNVGTLWQNLAHEHLPADLMEQMKTWAKENNKNVKEAAKPFKDQIDSISEEYQRRISEHAYREAGEHIRAFRAVGSASLLKKKLAVN
ncbi:MAG: class II fructose-bisphosphate aldolase [bacterium]